ncbi:MAG: hypothetical protein U0P45_00910 [Acidimicrobiales bacterium]
MTTEIAVPYPVAQYWSGPVADQMNIPRFDTGIGVPEVKVGVRLVVKVRLLWPSHRAVGWPARYQKMSSRLSNGSILLGKVSRFTTGVYVPLTFTALVV